MIEIIVVIVVLGIMVVMGTFGVKQIMDGYTLAQAKATSNSKGPKRPGSHHHRTVPHHLQHLASRL